jgi:predicted ArsR family transcriptional regulator
VRDRRTSSSLFTSGFRMSDIAKSAKQPLGRRSEVLRVLRTAKAPMSIVAIAEMLDVHPNTVRFHLGTLVGADWVEQVAPDRKGPGRPALLFQATRRMEPAGTRRYRVLAEILAFGIANSRGADARALAAGRAWGRQMTPPLRTAPQSLDTNESIRHLLSLLDELGFAPERRGDEQVGLRNCPFLELAETQKAVVCPIHLGLMQGALETWGSSVTVDRLDPFVEPDLCLAHLTRQIVAT